MSWIGDKYAVWTGTSWKLFNLFVGSHTRLQKPTYVVSIRFTVISKPKKIKGVQKWQQCTVHLLTHVLCKPTHFFFHSFIATMSYCLQTSFIGVMKGLAVKNHVWGTPTWSNSRSNSREFKHAFFHTKKEHIYMCSYTISVIYICPIISCLKGFALFYHIPHTYWMFMSLEIY